MVELSSLFAFVIIDDKCEQSFLLLAKNRAIFHHIWNFFCLFCDAVTYHVGCFVIPTLFFAFVRQSKMTPPLLPSPPPGRRPLLLSPLYSVHTFFSLTVIFNEAKEEGGEEVESWSSDAAP